MGGQGWYSYDSGVSYTRDFWSDDGNHVIGTATYRVSTGVVTFTVDQAEVDYLKAGETLIQSAKIYIEQPTGQGTTRYPFVETIFTIKGTNDLPVVSIASSAEVNATIQATVDAGAGGTITFTDIEHEAITGGTNVGTATAVYTLANSTTGTLTGPQLASLQSAFHVTSGATVDGVQESTWAFNASEADLSFLLKDERVVLTFTVTGTDASGGVSSQDVVVTIDGPPNLAPVITPNTVSVTGLDENANLVGSGDFVYDDPDLTNDATTSVDPAAVTATILSNGQTLAVDPAKITALAAGFQIFNTPGISGQGTVSWTYAGNPSDLDFLDVGQVLTLTFPVKVDDGHGGSATQLVTVSIDGSNEVITDPDGDDDGNITGTIYGDEIHGLGGADNIVAGAGNDVAYGDAGDDIINGGIGDDSLYGAVGDDILKGGDGNDLLEGGSGDDNLSGGAGDDILNGGFGDDNISGGDGNDTISGDDGDDVINAGAGDDLIDAGTGYNSINGGTGVNTLILAKDWNRYTVTNAGGTYTIIDRDTGEADTVQNVQKFVFNGVTVDVTGNSQAIVSASYPYISSGLSTKYLTEHASGVYTDYSITQSVVFSDSNPTTINSHSGSVQHYTGTYTHDGAADTSKGQVGTLTLGAFDSNARTFDYTYTLTDAQIDFLGVGQTYYQTFRVNLLDSRGYDNWYTVQFQITGTNDNPYATSAIVNQTLPETNAALTASGTVTWTDVDTSDWATAAWGGASSTTVTPVGITLTQQQTDAFVNAFTFNATTGAWEFNLAAEATQFLAVGDTVTVKYTITFTDQHSGTGTQDVTLTIAGTNDAPVINSSPATEALTETDASLTATGTVTWSDIDTDDTHTVSVTAANVVPTGLTLTGPQIAAFQNALTVGNNGVWNFNLQASDSQFLADGDSVQLTYTLTVQDLNGATDTQVVTINIAGTNDAPTITSAPVTRALNETNGVLNTSGAVVMADVDAGDTVTASLDGSVVTATGINLTDAQKAAFAAAFTLNSNGTWSFSLPAVDSQFLAVGDVVTATFTVKATDALGLSATQDVTVNITGTNDLPKITSAVVDQTLVETDAALSTTGTITWSDIDTDDTATASVTGFLATPVGALSLTLGQLLAFESAFSVQPNGEWSFNLAAGDSQFLAGGDRVTLRYLVSVQDSQGATTSQYVFIRLTGTNDVPTISGVSTGEVYEDDPTIAHGQLTIADVDHDQSSFVARTAVAGDNKYGTFTVQANGAWTYTLDSTKAAVQNLAGGETMTDTITVKSLDGSASQVITVTINGEDEFFFGTSQADTLMGTARYDNIVGKAGNDSLRGLAGDDILSGDAGNDTLDGGVGADTMIGGVGNDLYKVDDVRDLVLEVAGQGNDTIQTSINYTLAAGLSIENLSGFKTSFIGLTLTGNELDNRINGTSSADMIIGGTGADTMYGYGGNDSYYVDNVNDRVYEAAGEGDDAVFTSVSYKLLAGQEIEYLGTTNWRDTSALDLTGNEFNNRIEGNSGNNILNGGAGADTMAGYGGNDTYRVDNALDRVIEFEGNGNDTVLSSVSYTLEAGQEIEVLSASSLSATTAINLTGNEYGQQLIGNAGNNVLDGGAGNDTLYGYAGADTLIGGAGADDLYGGADSDADHFVFKAGDSGVGVGNFDRIFQFRANDKIDLTQIDADSGMGGHQALRFVTDFTTAQGGEAAGQFHVINVGGNSHVEIDLNGDNVADMMIQVVGVTNMTHNDFIFAVP